MTHFRFRAVAPPLLKNAKSDAGLLPDAPPELGMEKKSLKIGAEMAVLARAWRPSWICSGIYRSGTVSRNSTGLFSSIFSTQGLPFEMFVSALAWRPSWIRSGDDRSGTVTRNSTGLFSSVFSIQGLFFEEKKLQQKSPPFLSLLAREERWAFEKNCRKKAHLSLS